MTTDTRLLIERLLNDEVRQNAQHGSDPLCVEAADALTRQSALITKAVEALEAIERTTFIGVTTTDEGCLKVSIESAHDIANSALSALRDGLPG